VVDQQGVYLLEWLQAITRGLMAILKPILGFGHQYITGLTMKAMLADIPVVTTINGVDRVVSTVQQGIILSDHHVYRIQNRSTVVDIYQQMLPIIIIGIGDNLLNLGWDTGGVHIPNLGHIKLTDESVLLVVMLDIVGMDGVVRHRHHHQLEIVPLRGG
jgi:hypothetical protein